jgi:phosphoglucomutase
LKRRLPGALTVAWLFNLIGIADIVVAGGAAIGAKLYEIPIGFNWYIVNFYLPVLIVTHAMMVYRLIQK